MKSLRCRLDSYENIGFDMDGTLYPEREFIAQVYQPIAEQLGNYCKAPADAIYANLLNRWEEKGSSYPHLFEEVLAFYQVPFAEKIINQCLAIYRSYEPQLKLADSIIELLNDIRKSKQLFLVTDGNPALQRAKYRALGLDRWFKENEVIFTGDYGASHYKPNVAILHRFEFLEGEDVRRRSIYIGDREIDRQFAHLAGMDFLHVDSFDQFWS